MSEALLKKLREDAKWVELEAVGHLKTEDRLVAVNRWLLTAAEKHDENSAKYFYALIPFALKGVENSDEEVESRFVRLTAELFEMLPEYKEVTETNKYGNHPKKVRRDTLVDLKKQMLRGVAQRWQVTKDEDEASKLATPLVKAAQSKNVQQIGWVIEALHAATERVDHKERTLRLMGRMARETKDIGLARTLLIGVMRMLNFGDLRMLAPLLELLPFDALEEEAYRPPMNFTTRLSTAPLFDAIVSAGASYKRMHAVMRDLKDALKPKMGEMKKLTPSYPKLGEVEISIQVINAYASRGKEEEDFHDMALELRDQAKAWFRQREIEKKDTPPIVKLIVLWPPNEYAGKDAPPRFRREFNLG